MEQRSKLRNLLEGGTLYNHAISVLAEAYAAARKQAAAETSLPRDRFPAVCDRDFDSLLADEK